MKTGCLRVADMRTLADDMKRLWLGTGMVRDVVGEVGMALQNDSIHLASS